MALPQATGSTIRDRTVPAHILDGVRLRPCAVVRGPSNTGLPPDTVVVSTLGGQDAGWSGRWVVRTLGGQDAGWSGRWVVGIPTKDKIPQTLSPRAGLALTVEFRPPRSAEVVAHAG
jgi:hypothetical protein